MVAEHPIAQRCTTDTKRTFTKIQITYSDAAHF
jgi:hypothetical protein